MALRRGRFIKPPTKKAGKKVRDTEKKTGTLGAFYMVAYDRDHQSNEVKKVNGLLLGDQFFLFPKEGRHGGTPASARIIPAKRVFKTATLAASSLKLGEGFARANYGRGEIITVKYTKNSDGSLTPRDSTGDRARGIGQLYKTKLALIKADLKSVNEQIRGREKDEREEARENKKKMNHLLKKRVKLIKLLHRER